MNLWSILFFLKQGWCVYPGSLIEVSRIAESLSLYRKIGAYTALLSIRLPILLGAAVLNGI
jgi:hypothetical protein